MAAYLCVSFCKWGIIPHSTGYSHSNNMQCACYNAGLVFCMYYSGKELLNHIFVVIHFASENMGITCICCVQIMMT